MILRSTMGGKRAVARMPLPLESRQKIPSTARVLCGQGEDSESFSVLMLLTGPPRGRSSQVHVLKSRPSDVGIESRRSTDKSAYLALRGSSFHVYTRNERETSV